MKPNRLILSLFLLGGIVVGAGGLAWAQTVTLSPSLSVRQEYDDNILRSSINRQSDFVTSVSPGLRAAIKGYPWDVRLDLSARGRYYVDHPELNTSSDNQTGSLTIEYKPTPRFTVSVTDTFIRSLDTGEVSPEIGIITGRFRSTSNSVTPALSYQINPLTEIRLGYSFLIFRSDDPTAEDTDTQQGNVFVRREFTPRTSGTLRYTFSHFQPKDSPASDAHESRVGFIHALSPTSRVSAEAGPLLVERADGSTDITVGGFVEYAQQFTGGSLSFAYERSAAVAGAIGEVATFQSLRTNVTFLATRALTVALDARAGETKSEDTAEEFRVYTAEITLDYRVLEWLSVNAGYSYIRQDDRTGALDLERNLVFLGLTAFTDVRVY